MSQPPGLLRMARSLLNILKARPAVPPSLQDNPLLKIILERRSIRRFRSQEIPDDVFQAILEAGRLAPSTVNLQTWSFITFTTDQWRESFGTQIPFHGARAIIIVGDTHRARLVLDAFPHSPLVEYTVAVMNASLAAMNMNIAAEALGISSVMLSETGRSGLLDTGFLKEKLCLPEHTVPLMTIIFGYANQAYPPLPPKLPLDAVCFPQKYRGAGLEVMQEWLAQTQDGYRASFFPATFEQQLRIYTSKINQAEDSLHRIVFGTERPAHRSPEAKPQDGTQ